MSKSKKNKSGKNSKKRNLRKEILEVFNTQHTRQLNYKQVASAMGIEDSGLRKMILELLHEGVRKEHLVETQRGKFKLANVPEEIISGIVQITKSGRGFVIVEGRDNDIEIPKNKTGKAMWGDLVEVSINPRSKKPSGQIVRVIERAKDRFVGVLDKSKNYAFMVPTDHRIHVDFFISKDDIKGANDGDKVVVEMLDWEDAQDSPTGKVVEVLGRPGDNETEMHAIMAEYGLPWEFPPEVENEAKDISTEISESEIKKRRDFRDVPTFTIDPDDAKDFDDAISFKKLKNGNVEIGVHIADVSHYVTPGSLLDEEGFNRATSVYLVDRVVPMLPEVLSNGLCSLRPNEEKLSFSAVFEIDKDAKVRNEWFGRTVICSDRRFTYDEAQQVIETGKGDYSEAIVEVDRLAKTMRKERMKKGGIDFDTEEVKFKLDENGKPIGVYKKEMKDANKLVEEFMLLANRKVAAFIGDPKKGKAKTFVYRIHDLPDEDKISLLRDFAARFGYNMPKGNSENSMFVINKLLDQVKDKPEEDMIKMMAIRTMSKAEYSTENIGHYGLAFDFYSHFTSPIRRYPDVMVHRLLAKYLEGGNSASQEEYEDKCKHSSLQEKKAVEAERSSTKYKQVEFMLSRIGHEFNGIITGLTSWGIYVEIIENKCEGMVSLDSMKDDHYQFDDENYVLVGKRTGNEFNMGDKVNIKVIGANLIKKQLDFEIVQ
jgi:ribonuclease R/exosome complex exonuclease DIS3/RRP44